MKPIQKNNRRGDERNKKQPTSWGGVADWYDAYLEDQKDTYQSKVILPNLKRVLNLGAGERLLDVGCGQGFFCTRGA